MKSEIHGLKLVSSTLDFSTKYQVFAGNTLLSLTIKLSWSWLFITVSPLTNLSHEPNQQSFQEVITYQNILTLLSHYCFFYFLLFFLFVGELSLRCFTCQSFFNSIVYAKCYRVKVQSSFLFPFVSQEVGGRIHQSIKKPSPTILWFIYPNSFTLTI